MPAVSQRHIKNDRNCCTKSVLITTNDATSSNYDWFILIYGTATISLTDILIYFN